MIGFSIDSKGFRQGIHLISKRLLKVLGKNLIDSLKDFKNGIFFSFNKGGSKQKPVGLVFIGIRVGKKVIINKCNFKKNGRMFIQNQAVKKSLNLLLNLIR